MYDRPRVRIIADGWLIDGTPLTDGEAANVTDAGLLDPTGELIPAGSDRLVLKWCTLAHADGRKRFEAGFVAVLRSRVTATLHDPEPAIAAGFTLKTS